MADAPLDLISADNSALVLIDYQPAMFHGVGSGDRALIFNAAVAAVKAAVIVNVPVVLSSIYTQGNGEFIAAITDLVPDSKVHERVIPGFDALEDDARLGQPESRSVARTGLRRLRPDDRRVTPLHDPRRIT